MNFRARWHQHVVLIPPLIEYVYTIVHICTMHIYTVNMSIMVNLPPVNRLRKLWWMEIYYAGTFFEILKCLSKVPLYLYDQETRLDNIISCIKITKWCTSFQDDVIGDWINPIYLDPEVQGQIQEKFESDSEIELQGFLRVSYLVIWWIVMKLYYKLWKQMYKYTSYKLNNMPKSL